jgi:hypothetical protein
LLGALRWNNYFTRYVQHITTWFLTAVLTFCRLA